MVNYQQALPITVSIVSKSHPNKLRMPDLTNTDSVGYVKPGDIIIFSTGHVSLLLLRHNVKTGMWTTLASSDSTTKVIEIATREWEMYISLQKIVYKPNIDFITFFDLHRLYSQ